MRISPRALSVALVAVILAATAACVYTPQEEAYTPPPDPQTLLRESATALRDVESLKFSLTHQRGSIYFRDNAGSHIKATEIAGEWDSAAGLALSVDAYLVRGPHIEAASGTYFPLQMVLVHDGLYVTDPLSGQWVLQSPELAIIPVGVLNDVIADLLVQVAAARLEGTETIDGRDVYRMSGRIPATAVGWLPVELDANASADVVLWVDRQDRQLRQVHLIGAVGAHDDPGTIRQLQLSDFGQAVRVTPPTTFVDVR